MGNNSYVLAKKIGQKKYDLTDLINSKFHSYFLNNPKKLVNIIFSNKIFYGIFNKTITEMKNTEGLKKIILELITLENEKITAEELKKEFNSFSILYYMPEEYLEYLNETLVEYRNTICSIDVSKLPFDFEEQIEAYLMELGLNFGRIKLNEITENKNDSSIYARLYSETKERLKNKLENQKLECYNNEMLEPIVESENISLSDNNLHGFVDNGEPINDFIEENPSVILPDYDESDIKPRR